MTSDFDLASAGEMILMPRSPSKFFDKSNMTMFLKGMICERTCAVDVDIYISRSDTLPSRELSFITSLNLVSNYVPTFCDSKRSFNLALNKLSTS